MDVNEPVQFEGIRADTAGTFGQNDITASVLSYQCINFIMKVLADEKLAKQAFDFVRSF